MICATREKATPLLLLILALACSGGDSPVSTPTSPSPVPDSPEGAGTTYYVRPDGGSVAECSGRVDAPRSGTSRDCAWDHPFRALPPGGPANIAGGDTLIIAEGEYMMGIGAPGADACDRDSPWDFRMPPIPGGPSPANPRAGWAGGGTVHAPAEIDWLGTVPRAGGGTVHALGDIDWLGTVPRQ